LSSAQNPVPFSGGTDWSLSINLETFQPALETSCEPHLAAIAAVL
jgi:hypothetical protein